MGDSGPVRARVLCLGNDLIADDGLGPAVARMLRERRVAAEVAESCEAGLALLDLITGVDRLVVVDAADTGTAPPGSVHVIDEGDLEAPPAGWQHAIGLLDAMILARHLGMDTPSEVTLVAVEAGDLVSIGAPLSSPVAAAVPVAAAAVERLLSAPPA